MTTPDPIPAREAAFAEWLTAALLRAIPTDGSPVRRDAVIDALYGSNDVPAAITTGDALRAILRLANAGRIEWCGVGLDSVRRRQATAPALDASRLRTLASAGEQRLNDALFNARQRCYVAHTVPESAERVAGLANGAAIAEAELLGYRAAVADLLGALEGGA